MSRKPKQPKKLALVTESIRVLSRSELAKQAGGADGSDDTDSDPDTGSGPVEPTIPRGFSSACEGGVRTRLLSASC